MEVSPSFVAALGVEVYSQEKICTDSLIQKLYNTGFRPSLANIETAKEIIQYFKLDIVTKQIAEPTSSNDEKVPEWAGIHSHHRGEDFNTGLLEVLTKDSISVRFEDGYSGRELNLLAHMVEYYYDRIANDNWWKKVDESTTIKRNELLEFDGLREFTFTMGEVKTLPSGMWRIRYLLDDHICCSTIKPPESAFKRLWRSGTKMRVKAWAQKVDENHNKSKDAMERGYTETPINIEHVLDIMSV